MQNKIFNLRAQRRTGSGIIYVEFYLKRKKISFSTKVSCFEKNWNAEKMIIKAAEPQSNDKNLILENVRSRINNVFVKYRLRDRELTRELFTREYNRPDDYATFYDFFYDELKSMRRQMEENTIRLQKSVFNKLKEYSPELHFDQITSDFLEKYVRYLKKELHNNDNTAHKNIGVIRRYVRLAVKKGYMLSYPFDDFRVHQSRPNIVYLSTEELQLLWHAYINKQYEARHKTTFEVFLFMCFGSQHIGDARKMVIENFTNVSFSYYRLKNQHRKPERVVVPIALPIRRLLNTLIGERTSGLLFEKLPCDQVMNRYLKCIASSVCIEKHITLKTGRHTFATIFFENNPNPRVLQEILGHSDIKQTMVYVHVLEKSKQRGIDCFDQFQTTG
jgi:integrase/recombinase XerD